MFLKVLGFAYMSDIKVRNLFTAKKVQVNNAYRRRELQ